MVKFNLGYPKKTGNSEEDFNYMYNFICEMSDRLTYLFNCMDTQKEQTENTEE